MAGYQNQSLDNILDSGSHLNQNSELHPVGQGLGQGLGGLFQPRPEEFQGNILQEKVSSFLICSFKIDVSLVLARQFNFHRNYPLALINSITRLGRQNLDENEMLMFVDLTVRICQELGGARNLMTSSLVDILLQWTMPRMNKRLEVQQARVALDLVKKVNSNVLRKRV